MFAKLVDDEVSGIHSFKGKGKKLSFTSYSGLMDVLLGSLSTCYKNDKIKLKFFDFPIRRIASYPRTKPLATFENLNNAIPKTLKKAADRSRLKKLVILSINYLK